MKKTIEIQQERRESWIPYVCMVVILVVAAIFNPCTDEPDPYEGESESEAEWEVSASSQSIILARDPATEDPPVDEWVRMEVLDVFSVETIADSTHVVLLRTADKTTLLPIWIGESEALAIALRLAHRKPPRPLTHDLIDTMIGKLDTRVKKVRIEALRNSVFLGRLFFGDGTQTFELDARPSDSIALALGAKAPIFAARKVLEKAGLDKSNVEQRLRELPVPKEPEVKDRLKNSISI